MNISKELIKVAKEIKEVTVSKDVKLSNSFSLKKGDKVSIIGFGNFEARQRAARTGVNPKTGKKMTIPAKKVPVFRPGKSFKEAVSSK